MNTLKSSIEIVEGRIVQACKKAGRSRDEVTLIAVSKTVDAAMASEAVLLGIKNLGENRVQEAERKIGEMQNLPEKPVWHLIGHLQSNKVKKAVELFDIIHSVDSLKIAELISRYSTRRMPVLLEVNVAEEYSKGGFTVDEVQSEFEAIVKLPNIDVVGLMTIAPMSDNPETVRPVFRKLRSLRDSFGLKHLSMGMTDDFEVAIEEGASIIRVGRAIFGARPA